MRLLLIQTVFLISVSVCAQTKDPNSYQDFKLGMSISSFKNAHNGVKKGLYSIDCIHVRHLEREYPRLDNNFEFVQFISYDFYCLTSKTKLGEIVYVTLGFHKGKLAYINVIYENPQTIIGFTDALRSNYGKENSKSTIKPVLGKETITTTEWRRPNYKLIFTYYQKSSCSINSELTFIDLAAEAELEKENNKKAKERNKKRIE